MKNFKIFDKMVVNYFIKIDDRDYDLQEYIMVMRFLADADGHFNTVLINNADLGDALVKHEIANRTQRGFFSRGQNYQRAREAIKELI